MSPSRTALFAAVGLLVACSGPDTATPTTTTVPPPTSPPATAPALDIPLVGPGNWDRSDIPEDVVRVEVGDNLQAIVDEHPPGTAFLLAAGVHDGASVTRPKDGNAFLGEEGAVLDGGGVTPFAIVAYDEAVEVEGVVIRGLVVNDYAPPLQLAAIGGGSGLRWVIEYNEVTESLSAGIQLGDGSAARYNHVHHNRQIGMKTGTPTEGVVISDNDVSFNNYRDENEYEFEAGGMKIVNSTDVLIERNHVHANHGPGIWTDGNNVGSVIRHNIARDNHGPGIFHEISYDAVIAENIVEGNAFEFYFGGILVASSSGVEVSRNAVTGNDGGVVAIQEDRGAGTLGEYLVDRLVVRENLIEFSEGVTGVVDQRNDDEVYGRPLDFLRNTYHLEGVDEPFAWRGGELTPSEWLAVHVDDR